MLKCKFLIEQLLNWFFTTPQGAALLASVWGAILVGLAYFTDSFKQYEPFAYGVVFFVVFFLALILCLIAGWIWTHISYRFGTKQPTFIKFRVENYRLNLVEKSNIYKTPHIKFQDAQFIAVQPAQTGNRRQRRAQTGQVQPNPLVPITTPTHRTLDALLVVQFDKPIKAPYFHLRVERDVGNCPILNDSSIDERWAIVHISGMNEGSSFRLCFNTCDRQ